MTDSILGSSSGTTAGRATERCAVPGGRGISYVVYETGPVIGVLGNRGELAADIGNAKTDNGTFQPFRSTLVTIYVVCLNI
jgi:hypothetical protein